MPRPGDVVVYGVSRGPGLGPGDEAPHLRLAALGQVAGPPGSSAVPAPQAVFPAQDPCAGGGHT